MKYNKYESGRSMVEMLGTLAIMGVLSISGIAGYSYAMDKYRTNQTINDINLRSIDLVSQASRGRDINLSVWGTHTSVGYEWGEYGETEDQPGTVDMAILGIPKRVCEMLYDGMKNHVIGIDISGVRSSSNENCGKEDNEMVFYFASGKTLGENDNNSVTCEILGQNGCMSCNAPEALWDLSNNFPEERCNACENREMRDNVCILKECPEGYQRDAVGGCFRCEDNKAFIGVGDCSACDGYTLDTLGVYCTPNISCPDNQFLSAGGLCIDCNAPLLSVMSTEEQCSKCSNREWNGVCSLSDWSEVEECQCPKGQTCLFNGLTGAQTCISCDDESVWKTEANPHGEYGNCNCSNRVDVENTYLCIKKCPDDKPVTDNYGNCYSCDEPNSIDFNGAFYGNDITYFTEACNKCGNKRIVENYHCRLNPCDNGEIWNGVSCEKTCSSDSECPNGQLCLSDNTSCEKANYNTCKSYELVGNETSYLKQVIINGSENVSYWDAFGACRALGGYLDFWGDLVVHHSPYDAWIYSTTSCNANYGKEYAITSDLNTAPKNSAVAKAICVFHH